MASPFNGRWALAESEGAVAYFTSINSPDEHKAKLQKLGEAVKKDPNAYIEEVKVEGGKFNRQAFVMGEKKKDSGDVAFGTFDGKIGDGRPAKITVTQVNDHKITRTEVGEGFSTNITFEVSGDSLVVTMSSGTATAVEKFKRVG